MNQQQDYSAIVVGAGMTGIAAGYYLGRRNIPYVVLEAKQDLGGVWNRHRWHGVRCDSDVIKYSFSFRPYLSDDCLQSGANLKAYLHGVAAEFGVLANIRFGVPVTRATFDPRTHRWTVRTPSGVHTARFLINGNGYYADEPHVPHFPGEARFKGEIVHAAHLDSARVFPGKDVVVVGSGATAICCAPELARVSGSLVLLQRSPSYIYETDNRPGSLIRACQALHRRGLRFPVRWLRGYLQLRDDLIFVGFRRFPALARAFFRRHWLRAVGEAAFKAHFKPRYNPWQQRIPVAIGMKDALRSGRLRMKTAQIERFEEDAIRLQTGERLPCDVCVLATGLNLRFFSFEIFIGLRKVALERINLHRGFMLGGIPNYFQPMGSWHSAWTQRAEPLLRQAAGVIEHMRSRGLEEVSVERRDNTVVPGITPNYVMRSAATMPWLQGTTDLPSIDNLLSALFRPRALRYVRATSAACPPPASPCRPSARSS